jgi:hypothetical protein
MLLGSAAWIAFGWVPAELVPGTGRFANASGTATRIASTNFSDGRATCVILGTVTYAASDRKSLILERCRHGNSSMGSAQ